MARYQQIKSVELTVVSSELMPFSHIHSDLSTYQRTRCLYKRLGIPDCSRIFLRTTNSLLETHFVLLTRSLLSTFLFVEAIFTISKINGFYQLIISYVNKERLMKYFLYYGFHLSLTLLLKCGPIWNLKYKLTFTRKSS